MTDSKGFASLSPTLLARKGGARPAMRSHIQPLHRCGEDAANEDLGWNDMGHDDGESRGAQIVPIAAATPEVIRQREDLAATLARNSRQRPQGSSRGRRAAFTLRLDADRHLDLRLACAIENRSAQQIVTEALDNYLAAMPELAGLAAELRNRR